MERSKADSFSAYLEAKQRRVSPAPSSGTALSLLGILAAADQKTKPVTELMTASGMAFSAFADALKSLQELGYVNVSGPPSGESATLTQTGVEVSRLTH